MMIYHEHFVIENIRSFDKYPIEYYDILSMVHQCV